MVRKHQKPHTPQYHRFSSDDRLLSGLQRKSLGLMFRLH